MNEFETLLEELFSQAKPRPDLGQEKPVATMAGRVVTGDETLTQALRRLPMGSGEGDLPSALSATAGALAQPAMQAGSSVLAKTLMPKLLATMIPASRGFHGTPVTPEGPLTPNYGGSDTGGLVGPGLYLSNNPEVTSGLPGPGKSPSYAFGATQGVQHAPVTVEQATQFLRTGNTPYGEGVPANYAPQTHAFQVSKHNSFITDKPVPQAEYDAILNALKQHTTERGASSKGLSAERIAANQVANVKSQAKPGDFGAKIWEALQTTIGPRRANDVLQKAGFQSISYPGGHLSGDTLKHQAVNILDPKILQNLFDYLASIQGK